jgi:Beta-L-arabinofuranosidase, GH127
MIHADAVIDVIARAQAPDGYLNTFYQLQPQRDHWSNLRGDHELYCLARLTQNSNAQTLAQLMIDRRGGNLLRADPDNWKLGGAIYF